MGAAFSAIPVVDIAPLFCGPSRARDLTDREVMAAAGATGFLIARGFPPDVPVDAGTRADLLRIFQLPQPEIRRLWRKKFDAARPNVYRGWFPVQPGHLTSKEGIDLGADLVHGASVVCAADPLREPTPLPPEASLPGWRRSAAAYYRAMEKVSRALMRSIARGLSLPERHFDPAFERGLSTLRLLRYPVRTDAERLTGAPHVDSGFLTLLAQHGVAGLEARRLDGEWLGVPPAEGTLAVNFGKVLELWCGGRIKATEHRVVGTGRERLSIPFFYEARADAEIRPLPGCPAFTPFYYGDHLWATTTRFIEFKGMESLRTPLRS